MENQMNPNIFIVSVVVDEPKIGKYVESYLVFRDQVVAEKFIEDNPPAARAMFEDDTGGKAFGPPPGLVSYENLTPFEAELDFIEKLDRLFAEHGTTMAHIETDIPGYNETQND